MIYFYCEMFLHDSMAHKQVSQNAVLLVFLVFFMWVHFVSWSSFSSAAASLPLKTHTPTVRLFEAGRFRN